MNQKILKKQLGLKSTVVQRDYYSCRIDEDRPELLKMLREMLDAEYGECFNYEGTQRIGNLGIINLMRKPDMSGKMLIYLIKQGYINPKEMI